MELSITARGGREVGDVDSLERFAERKIKLRVETLYDRDELPRAAVVLEELLTARGRRNVTVTPAVEPMGTPAAVKITFRVAEKP